MMPPNNKSMGGRHLAISGLTGWDWILASFFPRRFALRRIAREVVRVYGPPAHPGELTFQIPGWPVYEVLDAAGNCRPFTRKESTTP